MRTDLVGGEDILAKVEALREQHEDARRAREAAIAELRDAKAADVAAGAEALRAGTEPPSPAEPEAREALQDVERHLEIVTLALAKEREALATDLASRSDEIRAALAKAEDGVDEAVLSILVQLEDLLHERAEIKAHVHWLDDTSRPVGRYNVSGIDALAGLRTQLGDEPGKASSKYQERLDHERRVEEWNTLVTRAARTLDRSRMSSDVQVRRIELDGAIEAEIDRMTEAGEEVPRPTNWKWLQRLGLAAKPKGKGTGWARLPKEVPTVMPPDTESAEARRGDLVKS